MATKIEWTRGDDGSAGETWNPTTGCTRASSGCDHCYAFTMTKRLAGMGQKKYQGLIGKNHFNGVLKTWDDELEKPLRWRKPRRVFVNSMSDLFHKDVPFEFIDKVFAVMALTSHHAYQILTKRPERMAEYTMSPDRQPLISEAAKAITGDKQIWLNNWPLRSVWLGTSVENQETADERIRYLLRCPAAVRFLSCEPLLGPVNLREAIPQFGTIGMVSGEYAKQTGAKVGDTMRIDPMNGGVQWVIVGGESGHGARPCESQWIRSIVRQCQAATVPVFVKQMGSNPRTDHRELDCEQKQAGGRLFFKDKKGGDISEWPEDLQVREYPTAV